MLREFSKELEEDRQFEIGGELFQFRYPHWEEGAAIFDESLEPSGNGDGTFSWRQDTETAIKRIPTFLDPVNDSHKRFKALVARKTDPVPRHQIAQLYTWLVQVTSGLPTQPPEASGAGGGTTTVGSSSVATSSTAGTPKA